MKIKRFYLICFALLACCPSFAGGLQHVKGMSSVGVYGGTGWGNCFNVGATYNYLFHNRWSVSADLAYERGVFDRSGFQGISLKPGVEAMVWHPATWFYLHLDGGAIVCYDMWKQKDTMENDNGVGVGAYLGFNLDFTVIPQLSIIVRAEQDWRYTWLKSGGYNYFSPLFGIGLKYNIR